MKLKTIKVIQGDTSGCSPGFVDIKGKVVLKYKKQILKLNFCFHVKCQLNLGSNLMCHPVHTNQTWFLGDEEELYQKTKRRIILAYIFLVFPSLTYSVCLGHFFLADELPSLGSIGMGVGGFIAPCCIIFSPVLMGKCFIFK